MKRSLLSLLLATSLIAGCAVEPKAAKVSDDQAVDVVGILASARDPLFDKVVQPLVKDQPVVIASFANIDDLTASSTFGRMASEVIAAGLTQRGYRVIELKMRDKLFIQQRAGEFMLSRSLRNITEAHDAQAVLLGTYAVGGTHLYVNARLVRTEDNIIISSHDLVLPLNGDLKHMLGMSRRRL